MGTLLLLASGALRGAAFPRRSFLAPGVGLRGQTLSRTAPRPFGSLVLSALTPRRPSLGLRGGVEVLAYGLGHLVVGTQVFLAVGQRALQHRDDVGEAPGRVVGGSEVAAGGQGLQVARP